MISSKIKDEHIIVVEDDLDDQFLIERIFERIGVSSPRFFNNGKEALDYLKQTTDKILLIISDINMPIMNGLELRKEINLNESLRKKSIPFVFLSTAARPDDVDAAYDMTVQGFFLKGSTVTSMEESLQLMYTYWKRCKHPNSTRY